MRVSPNPAEPSAARLHKDVNVSDSGNEQIVGLLAGGRRVEGGQATNVFGLPEGSVRALRSFSLLVTLVAAGFGLYKVSAYADKRGDVVALSLVECLATFIYKGAERHELVLTGKVTKITAAQIAELRKESVVVEERVRKTDGTLDANASGNNSTPVFNQGCPG